jgi:exodeoxyribonuclease-3
MHLKIVTWNVNSVRVRIQHLRELIIEHDPDIICLQELKCITDMFPSDELKDCSYNMYIHGQKMYNGVAILSKFPIVKVYTTFPRNPIPNQARFLEVGLNDTPIGYLKIICLYAPNGGVINGDKFHIKLKFYDAFISYIQSLESFDQKIIIGADFNIAPFDIDVYSPSILHNTTCCTYVEKQKLRSLLNLGLVDNFRIKYPSRQEFSWWDYKFNAFKENRGMRIDSILSTTNLIQFLSNCFIDCHTRQKLQPSDHAPVIACYSC